MKIGIDARYLSHGLMGGIHTYLKNITPPMMDIAHARGDQLVLYADSKAPFELNPLPKHVSLNVLPYKNMASSFALDFSLGKKMAQDGMQAAYFPGNYGFAPKTLRTVMTLHDEINLLPVPEIIDHHSKTLRTMTMMTYLHFASTASVSRVHKITTVSEYSKRKIVQVGKLPAHKVVAIHHGCPASAKRITDETALNAVRNRLNLHKPFILADALKNPDVIVRAWKRLPPELRDTHEIVFFTRYAEVRPAVQEAEQAGYAKRFVRLSDDDLNALRSAATVFVFPSWIEGFGIPLVEAMTCGAPIIASDRGSIPEVLGDAGLVIDAEDDARLADYLQCLFTQPAERERLRQRGLARAPQFTWAHAATKLMDILTDQK